MLSRTASRRASAAVGLLWSQQPAAAAALSVSRPLLVLPRAVPSLSSSSSRHLLQPRRGYVAPPRPNDGPLMERRADRELPDVFKDRFRWSRTLPWFLLICAGASVAIFNYQKSSSPVVASTLYALRTSPRARELLGDEIYFKQRIPWIQGEMNQLHGRINISFPVKGTRASATMRFASRRPTPRGVFETLEWSLETDDGHKIDLLDDGAADPFRHLNGVPDEEDDEEPDLKFGSEPKATRGFRQETRR